jgi:hypothetical protein
MVVKAMLNKIAAIDLWYVEQFARFLEKLEAAKNVDAHALASQFDNCLRQREWRRQPP